MDALDFDARLQIGGNNPPDPTAYEAVKTHIDDLYVEAKNFLDGEPIDSQGQADAVSRLLDDLRKAEKAADAARKVEAKPFDEGKAEVQTRYKPLLEKATTGADVCKRALAPWLEKLEAEKRAAAEAARREAEEKARAAAEAIRKAQESADLEAREQAELLAKEAKQAERAATQAENDKAGAHGGSRAVTLRTYYTPVLTDGVSALMHFFSTRREECDRFLIGLAEAEVRAGKRQIPGFEIKEERRAV